jgi:hypothetical protein
MALFQFLVEVFQDPIFSVIAILGAFAIGIFQGIVLGRAILLRFPRLQNHVKTVSVSLFFLFLVNAVLSVPRFASPDKIVLSNVFQANNPGELASLLFLVFGMNAGFFAVLAISITVMTFVLLKFTPIHGVAKIFVLFFSLLILLLTGLSRFTDLTPSTFEVFLYFLYHLGITIGVLVGSARKIKSKKLDWG